MKTVQNIAKIRATVAGLQSHRVGLLAFGLVIGVLVAACAGGSKSSDQSPNTPAVSQGNSVATGKDALPGREEFGLSMEEMVKSAEAVEALIAQCMSEAGFEYIAVDFNTVLQNNGTTAMPPLVAHLNIAAVEKGHYVDPEDWSPERTQYLKPIQPGDSIRLNWKVHALVKGNFASFVTIVSSEESFVPVVSSSLLIHVKPDNILPLAEVIPVVTVAPVFPLALLLFSIAQARRRPVAIWWTGLTKQE